VGPFPTSWTNEHSKAGVKLLKLELKTLLGSAKEDETQFKNSFRAESFSTSHISNISRREAFTEDVNPQEVNLFFRFLPVCSSPAF